MSGWITKLFVSLTLFACIQICSIICSVIIFPGLKGYSQVTISVMLVVRLLSLKTVLASRLVSVEGGELYAPWIFSFEGGELYVTPLISVATETPAVDIGTVCGFR